LVLKKIPAPRRLGKKHVGKPRPVHYHIPSFKNSKRWVTKTPRGTPLKRPLLITSPEFQAWMEKAVDSLESQLLSMCQTTSGEIQQARSKLFAMLSRLPADDSVRDLSEGSWHVERVSPGEEGCTITLTRIS
jgi:hypothetical protein